MNVMKTAIKIARCDYYQNEICKGFIECQDNAGVRQIPEPWNGDIESSKILILSSNPSYDAAEEYYPACSPCCTCP